MSDEGRGKKEELLWRRILYTIEDRKVEKTDLEKQETETGDPQPADDDQ
jgi:hypothetical protein